MEHLTAKQAADMLGLTLWAIYKLDHVLVPSVSVTAGRRKRRVYSLPVIQSYARRRETRAVEREVRDRLARSK